ncbi:MAG: recombinase family protein [Proteobacteria bacterium]|nr:recombinase family protein [Pseudomonadota bacterium]
MTKAYSYVRFSTPTQAKGDSLRRQTETAIQYALANDLELDDLTFHDLGVSAFRGSNRDAALGAFLRAVEDGTVATGSVLLVESLDRLSRDRVMVALGQLQEIIEAGVIIVTLMDQRRYDHNSLNDFGSLILAMVVMVTANEEAQKRSERGKANWQNKRAKASQTKLTKSCPAWLRLSDDRKIFEVIPERAEVVRRIFRQTLEGIGRDTISRQLNEDGVPTFRNSNGWYTSYIGKILGNAAVVGEFQPMKVVSRKPRKNANDGNPIDGYFPEIIPRADFLSVQDQRKENRLAKGRAVNFSNLFTGLVFCGCGSSMRLVDKSTRGHVSKYLRCSSGERGVGTCGAQRWRYEPLEVFLLKGINDIDLRAAFPAAKDVDRSVGKLRERLRVAQEVLDVSERRVKSAMNFMLDTPEDEDLKAAYGDLQLARNTAKADVERLTSEVDTEGRKVASLGVSLEVQQEAYSKWLLKSDDKETRTRLNMALKGIVDRVIFDGDVLVEFKGIARNWLLDVQKVGTRRWRGVTLRVPNLDDETYEGEEMFWSLPLRDA